MAWKLSCNFYGFSVWNLFERFFQCIFVSATPGSWEIDMSIQSGAGPGTELVIRPTGILDPVYHNEICQNMPLTTFLHRKRCLDILHIYGYRNIDLALSSRNLLSSFYFRLLLRVLLEVKPTIWCPKFS